MVPTFNALCWERREIYGFLNAGEYVANPTLAVMIRPVLPECSRTGMDGTMIR
jgi:hypothetical protein